MLYFGYILYDSDKRPSVTLKMNKIKVTDSVFSVNNDPDQTLQILVYSVCLCPIYGALVTQGFLFIHSAKINGIQGM